MAFWCFFCLGGIPESYGGSPSHPFVDWIFMDFPLSPIQLLGYPHWWKPSDVKTAPARWFSTCWMKVMARGAQCRPVDGVLQNISLFERVPKTRHYPTPRREDVFDPGCVWGCLTIDEFFEGLQEMKGPTTSWDSLGFTSISLEETCISKSYTWTLVQLQLDFT